MELDSLSSSLKILQINVNHSYPAQQLATVMADQSNAKIILITEPHNYSGSISIDGWNVVISGRAAIFLKDDVIFDTVDTKKQDAAGVRIDNTYIFSVYFSPNQRLEEFRINIDTLADFLTTQY